MQMIEDHLRVAVAAEWGEQADLLATLGPEQWDAPTLCEGWYVLIDDVHRRGLRPETHQFRANQGLLARM
jgi:hypothetical protein